MHLDNWLCTVFVLIGWITLAVHGARAMLYRPSGALDTSGGMTCAERSAYLCICNTGTYNTVTSFHKVQAILKLA